MSGSSGMALMLAALLPTESPSLPADHRPTAGFKRPRVASAFRRTKGRLKPAATVLKPLLMPAGLVSARSPRENRQQMGHCGQPRANACQRMASFRASADKSNDSRSPRV